MKTFIRLIRRYVLTAIAVVLLFLFLGIGMIVWISWREGSRLPQQEYTASKIADSMAENKNGLSFGSAHTPQEWMDGYSWAMVIDDYGYVKWNYLLPDKLNHHYIPVILQVSPAGTWMIIPYSAGRKVMDCL